MFETLHEPLLPRRRFVARLGKFALAAIVVDGLVLGGGAVGYHVLEGLDWIDATLNAALVMTGNGPAVQPRTVAGKLFTILDALLGVMLFAAVVGVLLSPVFHRILHAVHMETRLESTVSGPLVPPS